MDEAIDSALPPYRRPTPAMLAQPAFVWSPVARLVLADDLEELGQDRIVPHQLVLEKGFDRAIAALFSEADNAAQPLEQIIAIDEGFGVEAVDRAANMISTNRSMWPIVRSSARGMTPRRSNHRRNIT